MFNFRTASIDIGSKNIKVSIGKYKAKMISIEKVYIRETPTASYDDGDIIDLNRIKEVLLSIPEIDNGKVRQAIVTSKCSRVISREVIVPKTETENIYPLVKFELQQYLPIDINQYIIQYIILENFTEENLKKMRLNVVVYPKHISKGYLNLLTQLKLKPAALDINSNSLSKLFMNKIKVNDENYSLDKTVGIIDMGYGNSNIVIMSKGIFAFSRLIPYGGRSIDLNIKNKLMITEEEAEEMKMKFFTLESSNDLTYEILKDNVNESIRVWVKEIARICNFYINKNVGNKIDKLYLCGGSSNIEGIENIISSEVNIPVSKIEFMSNIGLAKNVENFEIEYYLNSIGAIVRL